MSLEAALWAFAQSSSFEEGCLMAVNLGDDADTTGAVYGALAGAYYGIDGIPGRWRTGLVQVDLVETVRGRPLRPERRTAGGVVPAHSSSSRAVRPAA